MTESVLFCKLRVRALGEAVADDPVLLVVRAAAHAEGLREPFDLLDPDIVGLLKLVVIFRSFSAGSSFKYSQY